MKIEETIGLSEIIDRFKKDYPDQWEPLLIKFIQEVPHFNVDTAEKGELQ